MQPTGMITQTVFRWTTHPWDEAIAVSKSYLLPVAINFVVVRLLMHFLIFPKNLPASSKNAAAFLVGTALLFPEYYAWFAWANLELTSETIPFKFFFGLIVLAGFAIMFFFPLFLLGLVCMAYFWMAHRGMRLLPNWAIYPTCITAVFLQYSFLSWRGVS